MRLKRVKREESARVVVQKRIKLENIPRLKEGGRFVAKPSIKTFLLFKKEFKNKMDLGERTEKERILAQSVHSTMKTVLQSEDRGLKLGSLDSCFLLLREVTYGRDWKDYLMEEFDKFKRTELNIRILEFRKELQDVCVAAGLDLEVGSGKESTMPRLKFWSCMKEQDILFIVTRRGI